MASFHPARYDASMTWTDRLALFAPLDFAGLTLLILGWIIIGWMIDFAPAHKPSVSNLMAQYRREWMEQMVTRDPRIFDAQIIGSLRQGTAFFASTSMLAIGGTLAMIGNGEKLSGIANDLILGSDPAFVWEIKLIFVALFLTNAFLKFVWSFNFSLLNFLSANTKPQSEQIFMPMFLSVCSGQLPLMIST